MYSARAYWICQSVGWGLWTLANALFYAYGNVGSSHGAPAALWLGSSGVLMSHLMRRLIRRQAWTELGPIHAALATEWGIKSDPKTVATAMFELFQTDLRPVLKQIDAPVLVLAALKSSSEAAIETYKTQFAPVKDHCIVPFSDARHFIMFDAPARMFERIESFLKGII